MAAGHGPGIKADGTVWVTERTVHTVTACDATTGHPRGTTPVGAMPIGVTAPEDVPWAYSSDETANQMSVIDKETVTVVGTIPMGLAAASPDEEDDDGDDDD